jgi:hypothetical protein
VFTIRIAGEPPWVLLGHPDPVKEVFTGPPDKLLAREANAILRPVARRSLGALARAQQQA